MKYMVINVVTRCKVELEATCPAHAVNQTPWPWEITECHLMGGEHGSEKLGVHGEREPEGTGKIA